MNFFPDFWDSETFSSLYFAARNIVKYWSNSPARISFIITKQACSACSISFLKCAALASTSNILAIKYSSSKWITSLNQGFTQVLLMSVYYMAQKTQSYNWVLKLNFHIDKYFGLFVFRSVTKLVEFIYSSVFSYQN